jgi:hypothetical protein
MKPEYKSRCVELISGTDSRAVKVLEMLEGVRPADQQMATKLIKEIRNTLERLNGLIEIS